MIMKKCQRLVVLAMALLASSWMVAQKKPLDHSVYDSWKSLSSISVSDDGKYGATLVNEQEGDSYLLIRELQSKRELMIPRAYKYSITPDQKQIVAQIKASYADTRQAKIKKVGDEKMPKDSLLIINLADFNKTMIPNVKDYKLGEDFSNYLAYRVDDTLKIKDKKEPKPYTLVLRNLLSGSEDSTKSVIDYQYSKNGIALAANILPTKSKEDSLAKAKVVMFSFEQLPTSHSTKKIISEGKTSYKQLSISDSGKHIAFLATADSLKKEIKEYGLYHFDNTADSAFLVVSQQTSAMPKNWTVSENYKPIFSKNEKRLLLGTAEILQPKDTIVPDFERAQLDVWHWSTPETPPQELANLNKKKTQSYLAYVDLTSNKFHQLGTEEIPYVTISDENNGRYALGISNFPYVLKTQWDVLARTAKDVWVFDLEEGTSRKIKTSLNGVHNFSPKGNYLTWYDMEDRQYYAYDLSTNKEICMTEGLDINFWDEKHDTPSIPGPYGVAAWMQDDASILVYDAYDIWKLDPSGVSKPENLTKGEGRKNKITLRYIKTDKESQFIKNKEDILLSAFNNVSKENGFYQISKNKIGSLVMDKFRFYSPTKAKNKNVYLYSKGNFNTSIDLYATLNNWKQESKLSDINPQQREYNWGTAELVSWTTFDNKETQGVVYKPEDFDPAKKYPVMIYFYEQLSDGLYNAAAPIPSRSIINIPFYCSRGYIVFTPDIQYTDGHPGESAYNSIVSGAEMLAKNSWVDKDNMAIQGQSWGGYQVAYLVTRTNMFKAAGSGAPVSNMFSAYGGIRWGTGNSRQYQYEQGQSRIGATIWEAPELYVENSPIFKANKVETPLLIMHNDQDEAVPWYQGIEYFMALRRLQKPVWMLQYNNEAHNLKERRNMNDLTIRLQQFFDHYLKGDPMPVWMKDGVKAIDKGQKYGLELK